MRVLDIDLDFFLADCCPLAEKGQRPCLEGHEPWDEADVVDFLENNCGLSADKPIPGRIFETHDSALLYWDELIRADRLTVPFSVTHVDAHSDLGIGYPGPAYVLNNVLAMKPEMRTDIQRYYDMVKLDEANYLLFALAFRWISSLENVRNPLSRPDIPGCILSENGIQLTSLPASLMENVNGREPEIPFRVYNDYNEFRADAAYDMMSVAISPRYAPKEADKLLNIFDRYMIKE